MATRKKIVAGAGNPPPAVKKARTASSSAPAAPPRKRLAVAEAASLYFIDPDLKGLMFVSSGCGLLDCALGGGWVLGRVANVVGDRSAGKTLLAIEVAANFHITYPDGAIRYAESESAFDEQYAGALGMPTHAVQFNKKGEPMRTVEDFYNDLEAFLDAREKDGLPGLYVLDSFDALSDEAEMKREINEGSYGQGKAKKSGELFRKLIDRIEASKVLLLVISQIRDKIGVTFGETKTRAGGKALDFYASHIVWLAEIGKIKRTVEGVERVVGVNVRANVKKNKVGLPFRQCDYPVIFGYGIDDMTAGVEWLISVKQEELLKDTVAMSKSGYKQRITALRDRGGQEVRDVRTKLNKMVALEWQRIERNFTPKASKY